ncbi:MAG: LysR family transcriptional regulator [Betaproteobacteria bacterium]|nr:MAG: LysR family transcriptional regulator [Betaproteobacteria bacterium]
MNNSQLELRQLRTLVALRETGSLSRAAQLLYLTQSALSHQIKALESYWATPIFERKSNPIVFTALGQRLLALADEILSKVSDAERELGVLASGATGTLRIAVECHTCFDWLMPSMDALRSRWPLVELDIVSGFHADPIALLHQGAADVAIVSESPVNERAVTGFPLFEFEIVALMAKSHSLAAKAFLEAADFAAETLITYPVPDEMLDLVRLVLKPAGVSPHRRTTELTIAMLQLVASGRGLAALPRWAVSGYVDRGYVLSRPIGEQGLTGRLYAAAPEHLSSRAYLSDFVDLMRERCATSLPGVALIA